MPAPPPARRLGGKRVAMVVFSYYPEDPRPRRAAEALAGEGMSVDVISLRDGGHGTARETFNGVDVLRVPLKRRRGGVLGYVAQYGAFLLAASALVAARSVPRRYDLVYVHNMPDILVLSGLLPKLFGARVILDLHDPMPELMTSIFDFPGDSLPVRLLERLERFSLGMADVVLTVNLACKKLFVSRSCGADKIRVVMNSPDDEIFGFRRPPVEASNSREPGAPFVIMYHGSLVERNGLDLAVEALARVRARVPGAMLRVYGAATPFLDRVMEAARARGLQEAIDYRGGKRPEDIVEAIAACDVGIIPNRRNIFTELNTPTRIFEYLALGKPVIAPRAAGIQDYFDDGSLVFFELGDAQDLACKLEHVFFHPREAVDTVIRGQEVYLAHAWRQERQALVNLTAELLERGRRLPQRSAVSAWAPPD